jgi:hypothetical protein
MKSRPFFLIGETGEVLRRNAGEILGSYGHAWDVLAEALQNAVDAINAERKERVRTGLHANNVRSFNKAWSAAKDALISEDHANYKRHAKSLEVWDSCTETEQRQRWCDVLAKELGCNASKLAKVFQKVSEEYQPQISVSRSCSRRRFVVNDNGCGIAAKIFGDVVQPYIGFKQGDVDAKGHKGVGLTFLVLACNNFAIASSDGRAESKCSIENANDWVHGRRADAPQIVLSSPPREPSEPYTRVTVASLQRFEDSDDVDLFATEMNLDRLEYVIRTNTAIGQVDDLVKFPAFSRLRGSEVKCSLTDEDSQESRQIPFAYLSPDLMIQERGARYEVANLHGLDTSKPVGGFCLFARARFSRAGSKRLLECFTTVQSASVLQGLSTAAGFEVEPGVRLAVRGMPTGVRIIQPLPRTGIGYWTNYHMVVHDENLDFDLGRKTPKGGRSVLYQEAASYVRETVAGPRIRARVLKDVPRSRARAVLREREKYVREALDKAQPLARPLPYAAVPRTEQAVFATFHELIGRGVLEGYRVVDSSTYDQYDEVSLYRVHRDRIGRKQQKELEEAPPGWWDGEYYNDYIIIEYKRDGETLLDDIENEEKHYYHIDLLVCYEFDSGKVTAAGVDPVLVRPNDVLYSGTTHRFVWASSPGKRISETLEVIALKDLLGQASTLRALERSGTGTPPLASLPRPGGPRHR